MGYKNLEIKYSYETGLDNVVEDFYIPLLSEAKRYDRITGFFSSTSLALASRGIAGLINNGGTMRMVCCPKLNKYDIQAMEYSLDKEKVISDRLLNTITDIENDFQRDHVAALGWMLANDLLEIKIVLITNKGKLLPYEQIENHPVMHQKVGILYDKDFDGISFSGSNNESASGWLFNLEEFKVFKSWEPGQYNYYMADKMKFETFWNNNHPGAVVKNLPDAIKEHLIKEGAGFQVEKISLEKYMRERSVAMYVKQKERLRLFPYQEDAVSKWIKCNKRILFQMVTGSGKTRTSIGCMKEILNDSNLPVIFIIACPQTTLSLQWKKDIDSLDIDIDDEIICDGTSPGWRKQLAQRIQEVSIGLNKSLVVYTTHDTCSGIDFIDIIQKDSEDLDKMFIGDEVHGMGSPEHKKGLLPDYKYRIGCSATPSRWFDEVGTKAIHDYFNYNTYEFTIEDALTQFNPLTNEHFLVNFYYNPRFISMTEEELEEYNRLTKKLVTMSKSEELDTIREFILFQRANIEKNAENKYSCLEQILDEISNDIEDTIIFASPLQIKKVIKMLGNRGIIAHEFTQDQSATPSINYGGLSEREYLIKKFKEGDYQVLVAIKCLDEGIDIPSARRAIIMASSTNPREYVQRIGRIIRQSVGKKQADIYDMIIKPDYSKYKNETLEKFEKDIFQAEMRRVDDLSRNAINNVDVALSIMKIMEELK